MVKYKVGDYIRTHSKEGVGFPFDQVVRIDRLVRCNHRGHHKDCQEMWGLWADYNEWVKQGKPKIIIPLDSLLSYMCSRDEEMITELANDPKIESEFQRLRKGVIDGEI